LAQRPEPIESAREAGLRYVSDTTKGISRKPRGKDFDFFQPDGKRIRDQDELGRVRRLAIPPAWKDVWICPSPNGHLQATGRDARGRKQYRYHTRWREVRDATKYERMLAFGKALPRIRRRVQRDLRRKGLPREKVLAGVVRLLETTLIRVGNEEYARENHSYGLTTLRDHHAKIRRGRTRFEFYGKSHRRHVIELNDPILERMVKRCKDLPGYELFQYIGDDGTPQKLNSEDVNEYLREITGEDFTAKDFRTWSGTILTYRALQELVKEAKTKKTRKRNVTNAIEAVAKMLGNTAAVCKKCYIHPRIVECYLCGTLFEQRRALKPVTSGRGMRPEEIAVMTLLSA
jgi:DNA topoisomerase I